MPRDIDTATYSCVLGYALQGNADFKAGTLRMLLVRTNSNGSIDVVGSMQAGFSSTEDVQVRDGAVFVNGEKQDWTLFPNMVLTAPTETPVPTEVVDSRFFEMPKTLQEFPSGTKADIPNVLAKLRAGSSHLTAGSEAPYIAPMVSSPSGEAHVSIECNANGQINCAPVAFMQFQEQGLDIHIIFWEIRNSDGSQGFLVAYTYDSQQYNGPFGYPRLVANPTGQSYLDIRTGVATKFHARRSYDLSLLAQPGFIEEIESFISTGNISNGLTNMIVPGS